MKANSRFYIRASCGIAAAVPLWLTASLQADSPAPRDLLADTWEATDAIGRAVATAAEAGSPRDGKTVGIFYYGWHGAHGMDTHSNPEREPDSDQGVLPVDPEMDYKSPYLIPAIIEAPLGERPWGPSKAFHHWAEPVFGFYLSDDRWVIRRHVRMLVDAGVDVLILEATNSFHYRQIYTVLLEELEAMRAEGGRTPTVAFMTNQREDLVGPAIEGIWQAFYEPQRFRDHWAYWKEKPLLLSNPDFLSEEILDFFTIRRSWAWSRNNRTGEATAWFGDGRHAWSWVDHVPQAYGWDKDPQTPEQTSVSTAQHPTSDIGKSFSGDGQPMPPSPSEGIYFAEQWKSALATDPEFLLITQWNEWTAMRFVNGEYRGIQFERLAGMPKGPGDSIFIDGYDYEFNRDIEPIRGGFEDNYYYQMVDGIRRFKGVREVPPAGPIQTINLAEGFAAWEAVTPVYYDSMGDTRHRDHPGWGSESRYVNTTGRNDFEELKVARDADYLYFYAKTTDTVSPPAGRNWMELFLAFDEMDGNAPDWEGFHFRITLEPRKKTRYEVQQALGGIHWRGLGYADYAMEGNELHIRVPRAMLGSVAAGKDVSFRFKWSDNRQTDKALDWWVHGDTAPNGRFQYRYRTK